jgi:SepF-like predicted cell division protein (DUF552 family)
MITITDLEESFLVDVDDYKSEHLKLELNVEEILSLNRVIRVLSGLSEGGISVADTFIRKYYKR